MSMVYGQRAYLCVCVCVCARAKVGGRAKRASRLLAALTGRKSTVAAARPTHCDVTSGSNGAHCWHQHNNDSGYYEVHAVWPIVTDVPWSACLCVGHNT